MGGPMPPPGGPPGRGGGPGAATDQMECPQNLVGFVIGKGGETIKAIQNRSGASVTIDQSMPEGQPRIVNIVGTPECVALAKQMVQDLIGGIVQRDRDRVEGRRPGPMPGYPGGQEGGGGYGRGGGPRQDWDGPPGGAGGAGGFGGRPGGGPGGWAPPPGGPQGGPQQALQIGWRPNAPAPLALPPPEECALVSPPRPSLSFEHCESSSYFAVIIAHRRLHRTTRTLPCSQAGGSGREA